MDVGEVDLVKRDPYTQQGISECHAGVGQATWVNDDEVDLSHGIVDSLHNFSFAVRLKMVDVGIELRCKSRNTGYYALKGLPAVYFRLALAKQVQIWAADEQELPLPGAYSRWLLRAWLTGGLRR